MDCRVHKIMVGRNIGRRYQLWYQYGFAVLATAVVTGISFALTPLLGTDAPIVLYPLSVLASALLGGTGPALVSTALGALLSAHLFLPPAGISVGQLEDQIRLSIFVFLGVMVSLLAEALRRSRRRGQAGAKALRESEDRMRMATEAAGLGAWYWDAERDEVRWNSNVQKLLGLPPQTPVSRGAFLDAVHVDDRARVEAARATALRTHSDYDVEFRSVWPDGTVRWMMAKGRGIYDDLGRLVGMHGVMMDITQRKQVLEELRVLASTLEQRVAERTDVARQRTEQVRKLARELTQAEHRERRRLAEVLHDHLQQLLVGARFGASSLREQLHDAEQLGLLQQIEDLILQSIESTRTLTVELSPPVLHTEGLIAALRWLGDWMRDKHGLQVDVRVDGHVDPPAEDIAVPLFQSVRELLFNVAKHARVDRAKVAVDRPGEGCLRIVVEDAGAGFDPSVQGRNGASGSGFGLNSVRERMQLLDGQFNLHSIPGQGTRVTLRVPLRVGRVGATASPDVLPGSPAGGMPADVPPPQNDCA